MTAIALLNIGSEILVGRTVNTNATTMSRILREAGYHVETTIVCHDTRDEILGWLDSLFEQHDVVLMTGGLGPTKDDITKKVLQERFGGEMDIHAPTLAQIESYLSRRGRPLLERNRQQALVPTSCEVLMNYYGSAPGMAFQDGPKAAISMPGVPFEMEHLLREQALPWLKRHFPILPMHTRIIRTAGIPESRIAERMEELEPNFPPELQIAYLPSYDGTKIELRLKGESHEAQFIEATIGQAQSQIADMFQKYTYALEDKTPDQLLAEYLRSTDTTMATAESCTGGAIAARMTEHSGISSVLKGGIVAYMRSIKESVLQVVPATIDTHGIVSEAVALEMAQGAQKLLDSDFAVATTGIAEAAPGASAPDEITQVWIGYADREKEAAVHVKLFRERQQNIKVATNAAILFALRQLTTPKE